MGNYYNTTTKNNLAGPLGFVGSTANGGIVATAAAILLPVYVCPQGVGALVVTPGLTPTAPQTLIGTGCNAANGALKLNGEMVYLWRAVDHEGEILES